MPRRTPARLRRLLCLASRNARNWSCFFNGMRGTCSKWSCKLQCGCMVFSTTMERTLAGFFANASACGTGKRALLAAHHSIPVGHFLALLSSLGACFNLVLLVHARPSRPSRVVSVAELATWRVWPLGAEAPSVDRLPRQANSSDNPTLSAGSTATQYPV